MSIDLRNQRQKNSLLRHMVLVLKDHDNVMTTNELSSSLASLHPKLYTNDFTVPKKVVAMAKTPEAYRRGVRIRDKNGSGQKVFFIENVKTVETPVSIPSIRERFVELINSIGEDNAFAKYMYVQMKAYDELNKT